jgi:pimeloyl-ACP methyl ester carboxylesterase
VILESGSGVPALGWLKVQPEVAKFAHVCSYDRAGYGWSEPGPEPRTSQQIAQELKALLDAAGEPGPYILVGHSFGGFNVRVFTALYPKELAGMVLVDASHEDEENRQEALLPDAVKQQQKSEADRSDARDRWLTPLLTRLGIARFQLAVGWNTGDWDADDRLSKDLLQELTYLGQQEKFKNAIHAEDEVSDQSAEQARSAGHFGDLPLIVLTAGKPYDPDALLTKEQTDAQNNLWINVLQVEEAHLSTRGRQIVVPDSGHMIPFQRPDAVAAAIHEIWSDGRH